MITKGQKINNRYEIIRIIGEGGMANVYLAEDTILNRKVAVKVLRGDLSSDDKFVRRFQREALSASSLNHPNIVEIYDVGEDDGNFYIVMEYVDGKNLKQLLRKRGSLTVNEVIDIMLQLTDGIALAHDSYIVHRDIKPQNILILENGLVKITDFGIAMALNNTQLTQTNSVMGSVYYLPPEQASGKGSTLKSDVYSIGILMYELLSGKLPFKGENAVEIALKHMKERISDIRDEVPSIPQSISNIILKSCAKNPKNRYNDAKEMYDDLKVCLNEEKLNEEKIKYKYPEEDFGETKILTEVKDAVTENKPVITLMNNEENKPKNKLTMFLIIIISLISLGAFILVLFLPKLTEVPDIKIPDVSNKTVQDAEEELKKIGFDVAIETEKVYSDTIILGNVVRTNPSIGRTIKKGTKITLFESLGTEKIPITDYTGKNIYEIKAMLELKGLRVDIESKNIDNLEEYKDKEDIIVDQSIKTGNLMKGNQIILYYPNIVVYPNMTGWTMDLVLEFKEKYELNLTVKEERTDNYEEGKVIDQSRKEGTLVVRKADFTVTVAIPLEEAGEDN